VLVAWKTARSVRVTMRDRVETMGSVAGMWSTARGTPSRSHFNCSRRGALMGALER
jgi:hypothetical protein